MKHSKSSEKIIKYLKNLELKPNKSHKTVHRIQETIQSAGCTRSSSQENFIPFCKERSPVGKLLKYPRQPRRRARKHTKQLSESPSKLPKTYLVKKPLLTTPSIGFYYKTVDWIKPSFAKHVKKPTLPPQHPSKTPNLPVKPPLSIKSSPKPQKKPVISIRKISLISFPSHKKGFWESMNLHGDPKEIRESLRFQREKEIIKECLENNKKMLGSLKRNTENNRFK